MTQIPKRNTPLYIYALLLVLSCQFWPNQCFSKCQNKNTDSTQWRVTDATRKRLRKIEEDCFSLSWMSPEVSLNPICCRATRATCSEHSQQTLPANCLFIQWISKSFFYCCRVPWVSIQNMASLHTLNLDHNLIDHIAEGVFGELYKLARLDMTSNRLRTLPPDPLFARYLISPLKLHGKICVRRHLRGSVKSLASPFAIQSYMYGPRVRKLLPSVFVLLPLFFYSVT